MRGMLVQLERIKEDEELGLTPQEKFAKSLGVTDGTRTKWVVQQINKLETEEEKKALFLELRRKKIISDNVYDQLLVLKDKGEF